MAVILIECLFADISDSGKYNAGLISKAIAEGIVGAVSYSYCGNGFNSLDNSGQSSSSSWKLGWNRNNIGWWYCTDNINNYYYTSQNGWKCIGGEWYIFDE